MIITITTFIVLFIMVCCLMFLCHMINQNISIIIENLRLKGVRIDRIERALKKQGINP
jgi:hypothetical protein